LELLSFCSHGSKDVDEILIAKVFHAASI